MIKHVYDPMTGACARCSLSLNEIPRRCVTDAEIKEAERLVERKLREVFKAA